MATCNIIWPAGTWDEDLASDRVLLDFDGRHRRRVRMVGEAGLAFMLDLPRATALRDGDGLVLDDGAVVRVTSAPERLIEIFAPDLSTLVRIAWHLGNRHLPVQLTGGRIRIRRDHVIAPMVEALGGMTVAIEAPFDPEGGAFDHAPSYSHVQDDRWHDSPHDHC